MIKIRLDFQKLLEVPAVHYPALQSHGKGVNKVSWKI